MGRPGEKITRLSIIFLQVQPQLHKYVLPNIHSGRSPAKLKYDIGRKSIMMQNKMKELEEKEKSSKTCLANILDLGESGRPSSRWGGIVQPVGKMSTEQKHCSMLLNMIDNKG